MMAQPSDCRSDVVSGEPLRDRRLALAYINSSAYFTEDLREQRRSLLVLDAKERCTEGIPEIVSREVRGSGPQGRRRRGRVPSEVLRSLTTNHMAFRDVVAVLDLL
jgi:hypothetical protein